jgi:hypothetical protein
MNKRIRGVKFNSHKDRIEECHARETPTCGYWAGLVHEDLDKHLSRFPGYDRYMVYETDPVIYELLVKQAGKYGNVDVFNEEIISGLLGWLHSLGSPKGHFRYFAPVFGYLHLDFCGLAKHTTAKPEFHQLMRELSRWAGRSNLDLEFTFMSRHAGHKFLDNLATTTIPSYFVDGGGWLRKRLDTNIYEGISTKEGSTKNPTMYNFRLGFQRSKLGLAGGIENRPQSPLVV